LLCWRQTKFSQSLLVSIQTMENNCIVAKTKVTSEVMKQQKVQIVAKTIIYIDANKVCIFMEKFTTFFKICQKFTQM
jgi:hypothetical protein